MVVTSGVGYLSVFFLLNCAVYFLGPLYTMVKGFFFTMKMLRALKTHPKFVP
jgi:hypothetical protein